MSKFKTGDYVGSWIFSGSFTHLIGKVTSIEGERVCIQTISGYLWELPKDSIKKLDKEQYIAYLI